MKLLGEHQLDGMGQQMDETYGPFKFREHKKLQAGVVSDTDSKLRWKLLETKSSGSATQNKITCILLLLMSSTYFKVENEKHCTTLSGKLGQSILKAYPFGTSERELYFYSPSKKEPGAHR